MEVKTLKQQSGSEEEVKNTQFLFLMDDGNCLCHATYFGGRGTHYQRYSQAGSILIIHETRPGDEPPFV
jgi:hypothetical protein